LWKDQPIVPAPIAEIRKTGKSVSLVQVLSAEEKNIDFIVIIVCFVVMLAGLFLFRSPQNSFLVTVTLTDVKCLCSPVHRLTDLTKIFLKGYGIDTANSLSPIFDLRFF